MVTFEMRSRRWAAPVRCLLLAVAGLGASIAGVTQKAVLAAGDPLPLVGGPLAPSSPDTFLVLLPPREENLIRTDLEAARTRAIDFESQFQHAVDTENQVKEATEAKKNELEILKAKIKAAKEAKSEAEEKSLQGQKKGEELRLGLLEAERKMRAAEKNLASANRDAAQSEARYHEKELDALAKQAELSLALSSPPGAGSIEKQMRLERETREATRVALGALRDALTKEGSLVDREKEVVDARLGMYEAQVKILTEGR